MGVRHLVDRNGHSNRAWRGVRMALVLLSVGIFGGVAVQCSSSNGSAPPYSSGNGGNGNGSGYDASNGGSAGTTVHLDDGGQQEYSPDAFFVDDPPPANCSDGGAKPPTPGGTPRCPDDKNLQGCPCTQVGQKAACWPGYRKNRKHGDCKDGETTCVLQGELEPVWGPCVGYTGIDPKTYKPLGTSGSAACGCFSHGLWNIPNTSPCFGFTDATFTNALGAVSTLMSTSDCPAASSINWNNPTPPGEPWSSDTVSADCTGYFKLCYTFKALSAPNAKPAAGDCVMKQVCSEAHYDVANQTQTFPDLPAWITDTSAQTSCAKAFVKNGGYAEMSVDGESDECEKVQKVFATINYCPQACNGPNPPAMCSQCTNGGSGQF